MLLATDHDCRKFLEVFSKGSSKGILDLCQGFLQIMRFFLSAAFNTSTKLTAALSFDSTSTFKVDSGNSRDSLTSESIFDTLCAD